MLTGAKAQQQVFIFQFTFNQLVVVAVDCDIIMKIE